MTKVPKSETLCVPEFKLNNDLLRITLLQMSTNIGDTHKQMIPGQLDL